MTTRGRGNPQFGVTLRVFIFYVGGPARYLPATSAATIGDAYSGPNRCFDPGRPVSIPGKRWK